jgi:hypothetical protein
MKNLPVLVGHYRMLKFDLNDPNLITLTSLITCYIVRVEIITTLPHIYGVFSDWNGEIPGFLNEKKIHFIDPIGFSSKGVRSTTKIPKKKLAYI